MTDGLDTPIPGFEEIFKAHYKMLCNVANNLVNDKAEAEDIVQDVFVKFWSKRKDLSLIHSIKSYLHRATINTALNHLEKNKKTLRLWGADHSTELPTVNAGEELYHKELQDKINIAIEQLPPKCRVIFLLSRNEDMRYQQIADHLGISVKTVENQMGKALQMLRDRLKPFLTSEFITIAGVIGLTALLSFLSLMLLIVFL